MGSTLLIVGLIIAFSVNGVYNQQINYLSLQGIRVNTFGFGLTGLVQLITLGAFMAELGAYALILGAVIQFSAAIRIAMDRKDSIRTRLSNGLISGDFILSALTTSNLIENYYHPTSTGWYMTVLIVFIAVGVSLILAGALLIRSLYPKSLQTTKV